MISNEDGVQLLVKRQHTLHMTGKRTYGLGETLGQVGKVKVGRTLITLRLKSGIETLLGIAHLELVSTIIVPGKVTNSRKTHFISKAVEATYRPLRVQDIGELGEAEARYRVSHESTGDGQATYPLQAPVAVSMMALDCSTSPKR